jgi:hypothetical protein
LEALPGRIYLGGFIIVHGSKVRTRVPLGLTRPWRFRWCNEPNHKPSFLIIKPPPSTPQDASCDPFRFCDQTYEHSHSEGSAEADATPVDLEVSSKLSAVSGRGDTVPLMIFNPGGNPFTMGPMVHASQLVHMERFMNERLARKAR